MMRRMPFEVSACLILVSLALVSGCGQRVNVTGKVVEKGIPIARAELRWASESDQTLFVSGASDETGAYVLDAGGKRSVPPGRYRVTVNWWRTRDGKPLPAGEQGTALKGTSNAIAYTAELEVEVTKSTTELDLDVTGKTRELKTK